MTVGKKKVEKKVEEPKIVVNSDPLPGIIGWLLRYGATAAGGWLLTRGYIGDVESFVGLVLTIAGAGYGLFQMLKHQKERVALAEDASIGEVK